MFFILQAGRIIAQFIVMGSGILGRAFFQAYRQAIASMFQFHHSFITYMFSFFFFLSDIISALLEKSCFFFQLTLQIGLQIAFSWLLLILFKRFICLP